MTATGKVTIDGNEKFAALGGDKGYYAMEQIGETIVMLTETAAGEIEAAAEEKGDNGADNARDAAGAAPGKRRRGGRTKKEIIDDFRKDHPNAVLEPFFASHRAVVERVFGWLK